ncbi:hypothetical protein GBA52_010687 [Prunus armeniaca]|nr:hypothetical protein GBA52_010687 [Prunus armeniaca]
MGPGPRSFLNPNPSPLLSLLHPLICHHKYLDINTLLVQFISFDHQNELLWLLLHSALGYAGLRG